LLQYIDPIIAATWSEDGAIHDVCKALSPRIREPNTIVRFIDISIVALSQPVLQIVFKALIVLHTMIRNGATDNVLSYLSSSEVLRLRDISSGNWEGQLASILTLDDICLKVLLIGYATPQNLQVYALY
jgi:hypothetical protein